jgi:hypothetical protein
MKDLINILTEKLLKDKDISSLKYTNEITVHKPTSYDPLLFLQSKIKASKDPKERASLAIKCAEMVLYIFEKKYPNDKRPRKAIEAAKKCLANPTKENKKVAADAATDAYNTTYAIEQGDDTFVYDDYTGTDAAAFTSYQAALSTVWIEDNESESEYAAEYAIDAVKKYYNLNEITVFKPSPINPLLDLQSQIKASKDPKKLIPLAIQCAEIVLHIFEKKYPNDDRPRKAIEAARACLANPTEENKQAAVNAATNAEDAADDINDSNNIYSFAAADAALATADAALTAAEFEDSETNIVINAGSTAYLAIQATRLYYNLDNPINEITVYKPVSPPSIPNEIKEQIKNRIISFITDEIADQFQPEQIVQYFLENAPDIFEPFIIDQMIFNNYEVFKNGEEILLSYNNQNIIDEQDIIDYINTKPDLQEYLSKILKEFYLENVEVDTIYKNVLKLAQESYAADDYIFRNKRIDNYYLDHWIKDNVEYTYLGDIIDSDLAHFEQFLEKKFLNTDLINEITVHKPTPLPVLLDLQSKIKASNDPKEKVSLAIQCVERVLYIYEEKYPNDKRPRKAIEAAKKCLANPTEENEKIAKDAVATYNAAYNDIDDDIAIKVYRVSANMAYITYAYITYDDITYRDFDLITNQAIEVVKKFYNLNESLNKMKSNIPINLKEAIKSLTEYMINQGMDIKPLPKLKLINNDSKNASNILGKTAHYDPNDCSITLYTMNRLPKDVLRSYAHEMIHRMQDNEGRLQNIHTTNTNEGGELEELEKEAYLKGNMCLRNWEDKIKNNTSIKENEESTFSNVKTENEWELKILTDSINAEELKNKLMDPKYFSGAFTNKSENLKNFEKTAFGEPAVSNAANIKTYQENGPELYKKLASFGREKGVTLTKDDFDETRDDKNKMIFMFLKKTTKNYNLVKDFYTAQNKEIGVKPEIHPNVINSTTIRFPLSDYANLNKILGNLQKAEILTNEDYTLKKQPKL